jgi:hypothetical protein
MDQATTAVDTERAAGPRNRPVVGRLFLKYVTLFVAVVFVALITNSAFEAWFTYQEVKTFLIRIQREQAARAAEKIGQFIKEIERQVGWTTQLPWSPGTTDQHQFDGQRLLRQVPAIAELSQLDSSGLEQLRVSRLAMDVVGSQIDFSKEPKFIEAVAKKVYFGPVYFRQQSEPYMTLAVAGARRDAGVSVAEVNLTLIWQIVTRIKVGELGRAYVVDAEGRLIAHPDISLVLRNTDMSGLAHVQAARSGISDPDEPVQESKDLQGRPVLTVHAAVPELGWFVFVELPVSEAYAPLYTSMQRSGLLLRAGLIFAVLMAEVRRLEFRPPSRRGFLKRYDRSRRVSRHAHGLLKPTLLTRSGNKQGSIIAMDFEPSQTSCLSRPRLHPNARACQAFRAAQQ